MPLISVILPFYNASAYLDASIDSLLSQTLGDFEIIALDDCSTDDGGERCAARRDPRLRLVRNETNLGVPRTCNRGIELAQGRYLARMDADDICMPTRFERQVELLRRKPEIGICGTRALSINAHDKVIGRRRYPLTSETIQLERFFTPPFLQSSVIIDRERVSAKTLKYDENLPYAQDFDLWFRVLEQTEGANLRAPLLHYRVHEDSITSQKRVRQLELHAQIIRRNLAQRGINVNVEEAEMLRWVFSGGPRPGSDLGSFEPLLVACLRRLRTPPLAWFWICRRLTQSLGKEAGLVSSIIISARALGMMPAKESRFAHPPY